MVRVLSILAILFSLNTRADFFGLGGDERYQSKLPTLVDKLKSLDMEANPAYEESFNQNVKDIENAVEQEKLFCAGESVDNKGRALPKEQRQLCFRELKNQYLEASEVIFNLKKKYLGVIHNRQLEKLSEIQKKLKSDIEKSF